MILSDQSSETARCACIPVISELGGEKIDIIEWSADQKRFVEMRLSPAKVISVEMDEANKTAKIKVAEDQQSLAIGKGGQNVRLAAKLTGWRINIQSTKGEELAAAEAAKPTEDVPKPLDVGSVSSEVAQ